MAPGGAYAALRVLLLLGLLAADHALRPPLRSGHGPAARRGLMATAPLPPAHTQLNASEADVQQLIDSLEGTAVLLGQPQYDAARNLKQLVNSMYNTRAPALIVYCASESDVAAAVGFAAQRGAPLCVRAGGHDTSGASICDGGVVVDVTDMKQVDVFPERGEAVMGAGTLFRDLTAALQAYDGLAAVTGDCPDVGIAGYTLGGGWGKLSKKHGLGVDNVREYRVVLPDGRAVVADEDGGFADLFWAMRGGGHQNFGVLTGLTYRVFQLPEVLAWNASWDAKADPQAAAEVLLAWQDGYLGQGPLELTSWPLLYSNRETGDQVLAIIAIYSDLEGDDPEGRLRELMQPLEDLRPAASAMKRAPWAELPNIMNDVEDPIWEEIPPPDSPPPMWELKMGQFVDRRLSLREWQALVDGLASFAAYPEGYRGPAFNYMYLEPVEGAVAAVPANGTAYPHRSVGFDVVTDTFFIAEPGARDAAQAWMEDLYGRRWKGLLNGLAYGNYPSDSYGARAPAMYYGDNLCRLLELKNKYDPAGVFAPAQGVPLAHPSCA